MSKKTSTAVETISNKPSEVKQMLKLMSATTVAPFLWGPPGIAKSALMQQTAAELGMAFVDIRLSQMDPTDLRGIPMPVIENGVQGVRWSAPLLLPRDPDLNGDVDVRSVNHPVTVRLFNPHFAEIKVEAWSDQGEVELTLIKKATPWKGKNLIPAPQEVTVAFQARIMNGGKSVLGSLHYEATGKVRALIALEEFNSAPQTVQAASYQLVLDRKLGEYEVPAGCFIVGAGNRTTDKGVAFVMPTPIMNRFDHIEVRVDFDDWQRWSLENRIDQNVVGFLTHMKHMLHQFDPSTASRGFPTPRSWEFVSRIVAQKTELGENAMFGLIAGCVGDAAAAQFMEYRRHASELPNPSKILSGELKQMPGGKDKDSSRISLYYALVTALCYELKERSDEVERKTKNPNSPERDEWYKSADYFLAFMMDNFPSEITIMGAKTAISIHKIPVDPQKMKRFNAFADRYKDYIMG